MAKNLRKKKKSKKINNFSNAYGRMHVPTSNKIGAILAVQQEDKIVCTQFSAEDSDNSYFTNLQIHTPERKKIKLQKKENNSEDSDEDENEDKDKEVNEKQQFESNTAATSITKIFETTPNGFTKKFPARVTTPNGTDVQSNRSYDITITKNGKIQNGVAFLFSPPRSSSNSSNNSIGATNLETQNNIRKPKRKASDIMAQLNAIEVIENQNSNTKVTPSSKNSVDTKEKSDFVKGGAITQLRLYNRNRKQFPTQKTTMQNQSASACMNRAALATKANKENIDPKILNMMKILLDNFKLEWLHVIAFSLSPKHINPQTEENLGCSGKWNNTFMMTLESVAKYFVILYPDAVSIKPTFITLGKEEPFKDIVKEIHYEVIINQNSKEIKIENKMNALAAPSRKNWPSVTDSAQLKTIIVALLNDTKPLSTRLIF